MSKHNWRAPRAPGLIASVQLIRTVADLIRRAVGRDELASDESPHRLGGGTVHLLAVATKRAPRTNNQGDVRTAGHMLGLTGQQGRHLCRTGRLIVLRDECNASWWIDMGAVIRHKEGM